MGSVSVSMDLPMSAEDVFAFVSDPANDPSWCSTVIWTRLESGPGDGRPGSVYAFEEGFGRDKPGAKGTITVESVDPPMRWVSKAETRDRRYRIEYAIEPLGVARARFTQTAWPSFRGWFGQVAWLAHPVIRWQYKRQFKALRKVLVGRTSSTT